MPTLLCKTLQIKLPIIAAPMFLVSNESLVVAVSKGGGLGAFPALNFRPLNALKETCQNISRRTKHPYAVNLIVNQENHRWPDELKVCLDCGTPIFITSLGNPKDVIKAAHANGAKVLCDVVNLKHALKVQDLGADAVVAVGHGAGGHAGNISPLVLVPYLAKHLSIPIVAAGGIAHGSQIAAALALGAQCAYLGTRFIASHETSVNPDYKKAILKAKPEDIIMSDKITGHPAAVIATSNSHKKANWENTWSAGQSVGLIEEELSAETIIKKLMNEYENSLKVFGKKYSGRGT